MDTYENDNKRMRRYKMSNLKVGLQLYSLRGKMEQNMDGTLKAVKEMEKLYGVSEK